MTKKSIIISSILLSIVALMAILFGAVFRLRNVSVEVQPGANITVTNDKILESANLKKGKSIFMLDKQAAINNIEQTYAEIKVVQIKTTDVMSVKIIVKERKEMFYAAYNSAFYCLDEDLKVLRLTETEPTNLIKITTEIGITSNTKKCDFMDKAYANLTYQLYVGMYTNVMIEGRYAEREDMCNLVESIEIKTAHALTEDGNGGFEYINLILKTRTGVVMQIANPNTDLGKKINICFAAYFNPAIDNTKGRIVIKHDGTNVYLPND